LKLKIILGVFLFALPAPNYEVVPLDRRDVVVVCVNGLTPLVVESPDVPNAVLVKCRDKEKDK
jgi:hypothetical protein